MTKDKASPISDARLAVLLSDVRNVSAGRVKMSEQDIAELHSALIELQSRRAASIPAPERSKEEVGVRIKPLDWEDCTDGDMGHLADTVIGRYTVEQDRLASTSFQLRLETVRYGTEENLTLKEGQLSVDQAKAAAQADYERRILSALEPSPAQSEQPERSKEEVDENGFIIGEPVEKFTGEARWEGVLVASYLTTKGQRRYVVEVKPQGFQMIAVPAQLRMLSALETPPLHKEGEAVAAINAQGGVLMTEVGEEWFKALRNMKAPFGQVAAYLYAAPAPVPVTITDAARDVLAERKRQVEAEGWTPEHDDQHRGGSMAIAAACYAAHESLETETRGLGNRDIGRVPRIWPRSWAYTWFKPKDRRRDLVKAGALILAEIERLDRAALSAKPTGEE